MKKRTILSLIIVSITFATLSFFIAMPVEAQPQPKVTICHKYGTPAEKTLTVAYPAIEGHKEHGDFLGACPENDLFIDVDGIATPGRGLPEGINVKVGDALTSWPTGFWIEGLDWFDNDGSCTWTLGDDLHLEDPSGSCVTASRNAVHDKNSSFQDCAVLDLDGSFSDGQPVDVDLESGTTFSGCPGVDPLLKFYDNNGNGFYDDGDDIVLDVNDNGIFD